MTVPRIVIAGASSDVGKTTLALGIVGALRARGKRVVAAKCGPDFIDASHLAAASGRVARNLDPWLAGEAFVAASLARAGADCDIAVIEGAMGLFDGKHGSNEGSSAHVARILGAPVVLVLDCGKASATVGAIAYGLANFDKRLSVAGVVLNRVASDAHEDTVRQAVIDAGLRVFGVVRRDERLALPGRYLGLAGPAAGTQDVYAALAETVERCVDLDGLLRAADDAPPLAADAPPRPPRPGSRVRVAIARDEAFWFYDESSLDALTAAGADLIPYSPMIDPFPDVDAAIVGGGYPEMLAKPLSENFAAREGLRLAIEAGMPVYAECGGLMYLTRALATASQTYAMAGAIPAVCTMSAKRSALRYVEALALDDGPLFARGETVRGHEFHYSTTRYDVDESVFAIGEEREGFVRGNLHASYVHLHLGAHEAAVERFVARARAYKLSVAAV